MNDLDDLEKELRAIQPKSPTPAFTARVADALGESGDISFCRISTGPTSQKSTTKKWLLFFPPAVALVASLVWMIYFLPQTFDPESKSSEIVEVSRPISEVLDDPDSPIHGVSLEELESLSGMPSDGWLDPQVRQRLLDRVDEGFIQRPGFGPGRQVRYHFIDETLWLHPASNTRVISTSPRQEVMIIDLDLY